MRSSHEGNKTSFNKTRLVMGCAALSLLAGGSGCSSQAPRVGELEEALTDERWWMNPLFPGSTPYHFADGHTWYDSDIGGSYSTGSYVRLPVDANYIADWSTGPVHCVGGGTAYFWSPVFQTTVNGKTTNWVFNHLSKSFLGGNGRTKGWYNGGALVGLTGGGTCDTGNPTYSTGPHFCNEMRDYDPYTYWKPVGNYTSNCSGSNGSSGVSNPVCGGVQPSDPCRGAASGNGGYCGAGLPGGNAALLYTCQNGATAATMQCPCGCMQNPPGKNDVCNGNCSDPCSSAKYGNGGYCGAGLSGGDPNLLYNCQNRAAAGTTLCKCGCTVNPPGTVDVCTANCAPPGDLSTPPPPDDLGTAPQSDLAPPTDDAASGPADALLSAPDDGPPRSGDALPGGAPDSKSTGGNVSSGCHVAGRSSTDPTIAAALCLVVALLRRRPARDGNR